MLPHNNQYIDGEYVCRDFADDFSDACEKAGITVFELGMRPERYFTDFFRSKASLPGGHAVNIIEVEADEEGQSKFIVVEPQQMRALSTWKAKTGSLKPGGKLPEHVQKELVEKNDMVFDVPEAKGRSPVFRVFHPSFEADPGEHRPGTLKPEFQKK